ncbi:MAG: hypothetical protein ACE5K8_03685 [Candidatus Zixiibacteriota bacterium]
MKTKYLCAILLLLAWTGCEEDENAPPTQTEVFSGKFFAYNVWVSGDTLVDSVVLTVEDGLYYLDHITHMTNRCSSGGEISAFGKPVLILDTTYVLWNGNCDSLRIPWGQFKATYKGDSLILGPKTIEFYIYGQPEQWLYTFRLRKSASF